jgi:hypothetical protein
MRKMQILALMTAICGVALASTPAAFANHCSGEWGSRCCYRQSPDPAWARSPGGYYVCDWPDDCHIRCHEEYNRIEDLTQVRDNRPENIVQGTCQAFVDHVLNIGSVGPTKNDRNITENVPGRAGYTWTYLKWAPHWVSSQTVEQSGNRVTFCLTLESLSVVFSWDMTQDVLRWFPPASSGLSQSCSDSYQSYLEVAIAHENAHAAANQSIAEYFSQSWNPTAFTITVCESGETQGEAFSAASQTMDSAVNAGLRDFAEREILLEVAEAAREVDEYYKIPLPDCSLCQ